MKNYIAGLDVAQAHSDICVNKTRVHRFFHNEKGFEKMKIFLQKHQITHVILEATGGYERLVCKVLHKSNIHISIINPARIRSFARAHGECAKTDKLDAMIIYRYGEVMQPIFTQELSKEHYLIQQLTARREQLVRMRSAEKQRLSHPGLLEDIVENIVQIITCFDDNIAKIEQEIEGLMQEPELKRKSDQMQSIPGVGIITAHILLSQLPEIGTLETKKITALSGLAPYARESGSYVGNRHIRGGRSAIRRALYLAALSARRYNPELKKFADRLKNKGKAPKVILIAVARKLLVILNAIIKNNSTYKTDYNLT